MVRPVAFVLALILLLPLAPAPAGEIGIECALRKPNHSREWWSFREVDGKKCWYAGRPGRAKSLLRWSRSSVRVAPETTPGESAAADALPIAADFSGTFIDRWDVTPSIFYNPKPIKDWQ